MTDEPASPDHDPRLRHLFRADWEPSGPADAFAAIYAVRGRVRRRRLVSAGVSACLVAGLAAVGVGALGGGHRPVGPVAGAAPAQPAPAHPAYRLTGALVSFNGCADYLSYVRAQASAEVGPYGLGSVGLPAFGGLQSGVAPALASGQSAPPVDGSSAATAAGASGASGASSASVQGGASSGAVTSQTNDQVAGVDEPDTVKTDGRMVVTLEGPTLRVLDTGANVLGSLQLSGDTSGGMLLAGGRAIVLSAPSATATGTFAPGANAAGAPPQFAQPAEPVPTPSVGRAAVVDLTDPTHPRLVRTFVFDGTVVAARLVGDQVRLVLRSDGPRLVFPDLGSAGDTAAAGNTASTTATAATIAAAIAANRQVIAGSTLADWLPEWQVESPDGSATVRRPVAACDAVARPPHASGLSSVSVVTLDPRADSPGPGTTVVAAGDTVYATADHMFVAGPADASAGAGPTEYGCCTFGPPVGAVTSIYAFDTSGGGSPVFAGSGSVPGWLINSYAMDELDGTLRVASTTVGAGGSTESRITVLGLAGGALRPEGAVGGLGRGEFVRSVRFVGDAAYVVTFRSYDPLYVVDLHDPARPVLAGQLVQPGYTEYLHPLPGGRLLGVGVEITGNEPDGLTVSTYDVTDLAHPRRLASAVLTQGPDYGYQGGYDPHALLYWAPLHLALLVDPGSSSSELGDAAGVAAYRVGAAGDLVRIATLAHPPLAASRSLVVRGDVWVLTSGGVATSPLTALGDMTWHTY